MKWFWILLIIYAIGGIALYFLQDYILFHPVSVKKDSQYELSQPHSEFSVPMTETDTLHMVDFFVTDSTRRGLLLYFHGNKKNISWYAKHMYQFTDRGYEVLMIDYPGYGKSMGKLTEEKLYNWALQVYKLALKRFSADSIIIYGKSMGTGIAAQLASVRDCKRLILESPYYDFPSVVQHYLPVYPARWMLHYQIPTYRYLQNVSAPITIFHGTNDWVIRYSNSIRLKKFLKKTDELVTIQGGSHNDLLQYPLTQHKLDSVLYSRRVP